MSIFMKIYKNTFLCEISFNHKKGAKILNNKHFKMAEVGHLEKHIFVLVGLLVFFLVISRTLRIPNQ